MSISGVGVGELDPTGEYFLDDPKYNCSASSTIAAMQEVVGKIEQVIGNDSIQSAAQMLSAKSLSDTEADVVAVLAALSLVKREASSTDAIVGKDNEGKREALVGGGMDKKYLQEKKTRIELSKRALFIFIGLQNVTSGVEAMQRHLKRSDTIDLEKTNGVSFPSELNIDYSSINQHLNEELKQVALEVEGSTEQTVEKALERANESTSIGDEIDRRSTTSRFFRATARALICAKARGYLLANSSIYESIIVTACEAKRYDWATNIMRSPEYESLQEKLKCARQKQQEAILELAVLAVRLVRHRRATVAELEDM